MYSIFFYFSILDLQKILEFIDTLNKGFEKYFKVRYDGLAWTDTEKFLSYRDGENKDWIYGVSTINDTGPHNMIKFWDDSFYISTEISQISFGELKTYEIEKIQRKFSEEMLEKLPLIGVIGVEEECNFHISEIFLEKNMEGLAFAYRKENGKISFVEGKIGIDSFKR